MRSITGYLLDTGIVIELMRNTDLGHHVNFRFGLSLAPQRNVISVVTVGEALVAAERLHWGTSKKKELWNLLNELEWIDINDQSVLEAYAAIDVFSRDMASGSIRMGKNDLWIAATAHVSQLPLITTDRDFEHLQSQYLTCHWFDPNTDYSG